MWVEGEVIERTDWCDNLFSLKIKVDIEPYIAGQFIKLSQVINDKRIGRAYSIVNAPNSDYVEVLAISVLDGLLSPNLQQLKIGDHIQVSSKAAGFMTLEEVPPQGKDLWLLATGTAVGPFISILDTSEPWERFENVVLVYGVREAKDLAYKDKLQQLEKQYPNQFKLLFSVTRESYPHALESRISTALASGEIEQRLGLKISAENAQVLLCGNPEMIKDANNILLEKGLSKNLRRAPGQITIEKYW
ncbi:ferredoxin--NADP reductase [Shewanella sp. D64]|uniref:ferredoxin--NADP reductase n=1 Tax=unclassified Shewanella TaxID=196818 RepID=UPI0022BA4C1C|nr:MULTISPECIES: ferredoxin--NADP reductase [unclassified Shewanella]MEC4727251.1 ferredoxin--NADP reductase [Shewanella sp. D64]MEC4739406.1 ferredoxin--NADP reductase [Shewanella sp. E94]WBJ96735.1 ferredoxin--NADP reductase [Shewanella sp. MTB7]